MPAHGSAAKTGADRISQGTLAELAKGERDEEDEEEFRRLRADGGNHWVWLAVLAGLLRSLVFNLLLLARPADDRVNY